MQVWQKLQDVFQVSDVLLIGSRMSEILVNSGRGEGKMEDAQSPKSILDIKKNLEKTSSVKNVYLYLLTDYT